MSVFALILAAGRGERFGGDIPKAFEYLAGKAIVAHTIEKYQKAQEVKHILLTVPEGYENLGRKIVQYFDFNKVEGLVRGGFRRQDSVFNALKQLPDTAEIVIIHDAARPFISPLIIDKSVQLCYTNRAVVVGIPCNDTIKIVEQGFIVETPQRDRMYKAQTPQVFEYKVLCEAYQKYNNLYNFTDDSQMVEMMGIKPYLMMGSPDNLKITTRDDLRLAEYLLAKH